MNTKEFMTMSPGHFVYIDPVTSFYFTSEGVEDIDLVVFEVK